MYDQLSCVYQMGPVDQGPSDGRAVPGRWTCDVTLPSAVDTFVSSILRLAAGTDLPEWVWPLVQNSEHLMIPGLS